MRPTKAESLELERLERATGKVAAALDLLGVVGLRLDRILRREPGLLEIVAPGKAQLAEAATGLDDAHMLLSEVLEAKAEERSRAYREAVETE
jgi:hypothetical protein